VFEIVRDCSGDQEVYGDLSLDSCREKFTMKGLWESNCGRDPWFGVDLGTAHAATIVIGCHKVVDLRAQISARIPRRHPLVLDRAAAPVPKGKHDVRMHR
jgi:hypothetical protein